MGAERKVDVYVATAYLHHLQKTKDLTYPPHMDSSRNKTSNENYRYISERKKKAHDHYVCKGYPPQQGGDPEGRNQQRSEKHYIPIGKRKRRRKKPEEDFKLEDKVWGKPG